MKLTEDIVDLLKSKSISYIVVCLINKKYGYIETIRTPAKFVICSKISPNLMEFRIHIACTICNSTVIELCKDIFRVSHGVKGRQILGYIAGIFWFEATFSPNVVFLYHNDRETRGNQGALKYLHPIPSF